MKPSLYIVTLAVGDLDRSTTFYRDGLGLGPAPKAATMSSSNSPGELTLVVFLRSEFNKGAGQSNTVIPDSSISLTYRANNTDEVDDLLRRAVDAGGSLPSESAQEEWCYHGYFKDPVGHLWEVVAFSN